MSMDDEQPQARYEVMGDVSTDHEYTNVSGDDCGTAKADPATDDGSQPRDDQPTDGSQPKRKKKDRRPRKVDSFKEEFTEVAKNGLPTEPKHFISGYAG